MKRFLAITIAGVMALSGSVTIFADGVTGSGAVEYDNSEDLAYDKVTVPTVSAGTYAFTLDPTGQLHIFDQDNYDTGSVYFSAIKTRASVEAKTGVSLFKKIKTEEAAVSNAWDGVVKTVASGAIGEVNSGFYVWIPDTTVDAAVTSGKLGKYEALTDSNIGNWFKLQDPDDSDNKKIVLKNDYKSGTNVCDGKIYKDDYEAITGDKITDSDLDSIGNYVTIDSTGAATAFPNLYKEDSGSKVAATSADITVTKSETGNIGRTDAATVINKSTKDKTVTATVTMNNVSGLTFKNSATFASDDTDTSVYFAATNGTTTNALEAASDGTKATVTYTVDLDGVSTDDQITYQASGTTDIGGHQYLRYEAPDVTYDSDSFYITAAANTNAGAAAKWKEWADGLTVAPTINVVYSVTDKDSGSTNVATVDIAANGAFTITAPSNKTFDSETFESLYEGEYDDLTAWNNAPSLGSNDTVWTVPVSTLQWLEKDATGAYKFKVKYDGDTEETEVSFAPTVPIVLPSANGITITAPYGKTFVSSIFKTLYDGETDVDITSWNTKPTLSSENTVWSITSSTLEYLDKDSDGAYNFTVKLSDAADSVTVTYEA